MMNTDNSSEKNSVKVNRSRRSFAKTGIAVPVIMTLANKTALGSIYQCTISGMQSGNMSSHGDGIDCGVGYSPGGIRQNACKSGEQDGNIKQWIEAGLIPFEIGSDTAGDFIIHFYNNSETKHYVSSSGTGAGNGTGPGTGGRPGNGNIPGEGGCDWKDVYDAIKIANKPVTMFKDIFGGASNSTLHQMLGNSGGMVFQAISAYWNAAYHQATGNFGAVYEGISPSYILHVYHASEYTDQQKQTFFEMIHHDN